MKGAFARQALPTAASLDAYFQKTVPSVEDWLAQTWEDKTDWAKEAQKAHPDIVELREYLEKFAPKMPKLLQHPWHDRPHDESYRSEYLFRFPNRLDNQPCIDSINYNVIERLHALLGFDLKHGI